MGNSDEDNYALTKRLTLASIKSTKKCQTLSNAYVLSRQDELQDLLSLSCFLWKVRRIKVMTHIHILLDKRLTV